MLTKILKLILAKNYNLANVLMKQSDISSIDIARDLARFYYKHDIHIDSFDTAEKIGHLINECDYKLINIPPICEDKLLVYLPIIKCSQMIFFIDIDYDLISNVTFNECVNYIRFSDTLNLSTEFVKNITRCNPNVKILHRQQFL